MWTISNIAESNMLKNINSCYDCTHILVSAIALERYIGTFMALRYEELVTPGRVTVALVFAVAYPMTLVIPMALAEHIYSPSLPCLFPTVFSPGIVHIIAVHVEVTLVVIAVVYIKILHQAYAHRRHITARSNLGQPGEDQAQANTMREGLEVIKIFALIIGVFAASLLPFFILSQIIVHDPENYLMIPAVAMMWPVVALMLVVNNFINPVIYALKFKTYPMSFKTLLGCTNNNRVATEDP